MSKLSIGTRTVLTWVLYILSVNVIKVRQKIKQNYALIYHQAFICPLNFVFNSFTTKWVFLRYPSYLSFPRVAMSEEVVYVC